METVIEALVWIAPWVLLLAVAGWLSDVVMPKLEAWFDRKIAELLAWVNTLMDYADD